MSLGKAGLIMPDQENFWTNRGYILIPPAKMALDHENAVQCPKYQPLVMFIGGARDAEDKNVLSGIFSPYDKANEPFQDVGYGTYQTGGEVAQIATHWHLQGQKICLVGHSYGGDTVMDVVTRLANEGVPVEIAVTLDPVSRIGAGANQPKPPSLKRWLNIYVDYAKVGTGGITTPNSVALAGGSWGHCDQADINKSLDSVSTEDYKGYDHAAADHMFLYSGYSAEVEKVR
jgi:alpha/beta superfamily hydrolase